LRKSGPTPSSHCEATPCPTTTTNYLPPRTRMASECTLLTYVRTSLALLGFGLAHLQLRPVRARTLSFGVIGAALVTIMVSW
jgi:uncharacterized membrane protein YidH (DUF202 family)